MDIFGNIKKMFAKKSKPIQNHYYKYDLWADIKDQLAEKIPKGYTLYGEYIGYDKNGGYIQSPYDYGCDEKEGKIYVYRITITNSDGEVIELSDLQIAEFCKLRGLNYEDTFIYYGKAKDLYPELKLTEHWHQEFVKNLERDFNNKDCHMCKNVVPEEGIVVRRQSTFEYEAYKLKSARFFEFETEQLDKGVIDIETLETTEDE